MVAIAVGGFHEHIIGRGRRFGVAHNQRLRPPDIAGKNDARSLAVFVGLDSQGAGTQNVPRVIISHADTRSRFKDRMIFHFLKEGGRSDGVIGGIEGRRRILEAAPLILGGRPLRFHFLNVRAVLKHELQQFRRGARAVDGPRKAMLHQHGQKPGVIHVGMSHKHKIQRLGSVGLFIAVTLFNSLVTLMQAAIHAETLAAGLQHKAGAGYRLSSAQKLYLHGDTSLLHASHPQSLLAGLSLFFDYAPHFLQAQEGKGARPACSRGNSDLL